MSTTTRRNVTAVKRGDTVEVVPGALGRVIRVVTEPTGWIRLDFRFSDGSREHQWYELHEGVEVVL